MHVKTDFYRFSVLGGDMRQVYLAKLLAQQGHDVTVYGLCAPAGDSHGRMVTEVKTLKKAAEAADILLCPTPFLKAGKVFFQNPEDAACPEEFLSEVCSGKLIIAGAISEQLREKMREQGAECFDLMEDETVAVRNSIATAEGAIAEAIIQSPYNLSESRCLILGYGRCGTALAAYLRCLCRSLTVCARSPAARAKAAVCADEVTDFKNLYRVLKRSDLIFNTIPCEILNRHMVKHIPSESLILDLASAPGGVDLDAAKECGVRAAACPGLPGKYAPAASASVLADAVLKILSGRDYPAYAGAGNMAAGAPAD